MLKKLQNRLLARAAQNHGHAFRATDRAATARERSSGGVFSILLVVATLPVLPAQTVGKHDFRSSSGYTFYAPVNAAASYLIRDDGTVVHQWAGSTRVGNVAYLRPDGSILRTGTMLPEPFRGFAGAGGTIEEIAWDGTLTWRYTLSSDSHLRHHDIEPMGNGNVLVVAWERKTAEEAIAAGRDPSRIMQGAVWSEAIYEIRPTRPAGGEVVWEWHAWDHLVQDFDATKPNYGDVAAHPERVDLNFGEASPGPSWLHFNSISYNPKFDQIMVSSRMFSEIWILDHAPQAVNRGIIYRWGNPEAYRAGTAADRRLFNQHDAHWIPGGLPGEGNILVFNNGPARGYSTVDEIVPPLDDHGKYGREAGAAFGPGELNWTYGDRPDQRFLSVTFGGVQRLANGNTLICISNATRLIEVTPEGEVVWEASIAPGDPAQAGGGGSFRATRVLTNLDGFRETLLFHAAPSLRNAASLGGGALAPEALAVAVGEDMTTSTRSVGVTILDSAGVTRSAHVSYSSPERIHFQIPGGTAIGPARVIARDGSGRQQSSDVRIDPVSPALFSANGDGSGAGAIVAVGVSRAGRTEQPAFRAGDGEFVADALSFGDQDEQLYLLLFGTGLRRAKTVTATIGPAPAPVLGVAPQSEFAGLDQVNLGPLPRSLAGSGEQPVVLIVDGRRTNPVTVAFR